MNNQTPATTHLYTLDILDLIGYATLEHFDSNDFAALVKVAEWCSQSSAVEANILSGGKIIYSINSK